MFHDLLNLFYPRTCNCCSGSLLKNEQILCTRCIHELPLASSSHDGVNPTLKIFHGRIPVQYATSLLLFGKKGAVQKLIHRLKYKGNQEIGQFFGKWMGGELKDLEAYKNITAVIPVPLHKTKLRKRGYNQVEKFGKEIALALKVPYIDNVLVKKRVSKTQTLKKRFARWGTLEETFLVEQPHMISNAHLLVVDDLVTTGATLEACASGLLAVEGTKVSFATLAITQ